MLDFCFHRAEVRSYILDLLLELVFIHEEVHSSAKGEFQFQI
jgi:hypothetical protein